MKGASGSSGARNFFVLARYGVGILCQARPVITCSCGWMHAARCIAAERIRCMEHGDSVGSCCLGLAWFPSHQLQIANLVSIRLVACCCLLGADIAGASL